MSNLDPLARAAPAAQSFDPVAAEIASLTADADALRTMVSSGDIVAGRVLPFNGLTDLVEILGKRVAAQLPPTVRPGETLILEVQGFDGDRIVVRNLGVDQQAQGQAPVQGAQGQRSAPLPPTPAPLNSSAAPLDPSPAEQLPYTPASGAAAPLPLPPLVAPSWAGQSGAPQGAALAAAASGDEAAAAETEVDESPVEGALASPGGAEAAAAGEPQIAPPGRPGVALPRSVMIRASVKTTDGPAEPPPAGSEEHPRVTFNVPSRAIETEKSLEARLIAARAAPRASGAPGARQIPAANQRGPVPQLPASQARAVPPPAAAARDAAVKNVPPGTAGNPQRVSSAPLSPAALNAQRPGGASWIETMTRTVMAKANLAAPAAPAEEAREPAAPPPELHSTTALATAPRLAESYREPTVLLRALRLPVTPTNVAAAKLALESPQRLPHALATLERALPLGNADPRVNTLRTLAAFVGNPDPRSQAFPAQISAYVSHVLEGPEAKLTTLLQLFGRTTAPPEDADDDAAGAQTALEAEAEANAAPGASTAQPAAPAQAGSTPASQPQVPAHDAPPAQLDTSTQARFAERTTAMEYDLKSVLQSFISQPPPGAAPASLAAAHAALTAITAAQLGVVTAQTDPRVLALEIPLPFTANGSPAKIMVTRDKPDGEGPLTADNFHIAFVLDTKNVGTVAIDLLTVGREVSVAVKSETPQYAAAFKSKLDELGRRLGHLRYNVSSMESGIVSRAGATTTIAAPAPPPQERDDDSSAWDLRV